MQISKISQNSPSFGCKMTQSYVNQVKKTYTKKYNKNVANILLKCVKKFDSDKVILDYKNSKYVLAIPEYNVSKTYIAKMPIPSFDVTDALHACIEKIIKKSQKKGDLDIVVPKLLIDFPHLREIEKPEEIERDLLKLKKKFEEIKKQKNI